MGHVTQTNESCHTYERVTSHTTGVGRIPQALEGVRPDLHRPYSRGQVRGQRLSPDPGSRHRRSRVLPLPFHLVVRSAACWRKNCCENSLLGLETNCCGHFVLCPQYMQYDAPVCVRSVRNNSFLCWGWKRTVADTSF